MKLSAPTQPVFIIACILALIGLLAFLGVIAPIQVHSFWLMTSGFVVLALGCLLKGM